MSTFRAPLYAALACVALAAGACGAARSGTDTSSAPSARPTDDSKAGIEALYRARMDSARMRYTDADVRFMIGMIGHHAQALVMCRLAPENDAGPRVATLCSRILNSQGDEIVLMQRWLRQRGEFVPQVTIDGIHLEVTGPEYVMHMPGMLSDEQLRELAAARGPDFDRLFLEGMIHHHQGAVGMVDKLFAQDGAAQDEAAFKLANDIQVDQKTEIARMKRMLSELTSANRGNR
ncbi:MAG TPA: DUF305 domain-containing protein [Gemmatimonadota bacterium]|nr:DUF305 domain-containing protein [Gemmatimonadota bacterium]